HVPAGYLACEENVPRDRHLCPAAGNFDSRWIYAYVSIAYAVGSSGSYATKPCGVVRALEPQLVRVGFILGHEPFIPRRAGVDIECDTPNVACPVWVIPGSLEDYPGPAARA